MSYCKMVDYMCPIHILWQPAEHSEHSMTERLVISRNDQLNKIVKLVIKLYSETLYYYVFS